MRNQAAYISSRNTVPVLINSPFRNIGGMVPRIPELLQDQTMDGSSQGDRPLWTCESERSIQNERS